MSMWQMDNDRVSLTRIANKSTICRESPTHQLRHFVGIADLKRKPTVLWLCMRYKGKLVFLSVSLRFSGFGLVVI